MKTYRIVISQEFEVKSENIVQAKKFAVKHLNVIGARAMFYSPSSKDRDTLKLFVQKIGSKKVEVLK